MLQSDFCAVIEILLNFILSSGFSAFRLLYNQYITLIALLVFVENGEFKRYKTIFWKMKKKKGLSIKLTGLISMQSTFSIKIKI